MSFSEQFKNIYCIDTRMFGFKQYCAAYLIKGKELALIDTGMASQKAALLEGIHAHGFSVSDISYIFVSHCDHFDHSGNVGTIIRENPKAKIYIHPSGIECLTHPEISSEKRKLRMPLAMAARYGESIPTPSSVLAWCGMERYLTWVRMRNCKLFLLRAISRTGLSCMNISTKDCLLMIWWETISPMPVAAMP